jgi:hypothetical protein
MEYLSFQNDGFDAASIHNQTEQRFAACFE